MSEQGKQHPDAGQNQDGGKVNAAQQGQPEAQQNSWNNESENKHDNYGAGSDQITNQNYGQGSDTQSGHDTSSAGLNSNPTGGNQENSGYTTKVTPEVPGREKPHQTDTPKADGNQTQNTSSTPQA